MTLHLYYPSINFPKPHICLTTHSYESYYKSISKKLTSTFGWKIFKKLIVMKGKIEILAFFMFMICSGMVSGNDTLQTECATLFTKMTNCLAFASGKNDAPTKECCTSVTEVKDSNPACLCFFIQQVHKGDANLKSLGLQETRLLQLPSVCKLTNASVSECPKLLNLPANSPDATIFKNASNASSSPATSQSTTAKSNSLKKTPNLTIHVALAIVEILFFTCSSVVAFIS